MDSDRQAMVVDAIWPWRRTGGKTGQPDPAARRKRAVVEACVALAVALLLTFVFHKRIIGAIVFCIAALVLVGGLFVPPLYAGFKKAGVFLAKVVGVVLSWGLLVPFFYICFTVGRFVLLVSGKDPMRRKFDRDLKSYWSVHTSMGGADRYSRQY